MRSLGRSLRDRILPAVLTAAGVALLAAGLLSYTGSAVAADPGASAAPSEIAVDSSPSLDLPTLPPPGGSPSAVPSPSPGGKAVATRVVIEALGIDLPIVKPRPGSAYPYCNVAMYLSDPRLGQPGGDKASYIYAHARDGMFGPIYDRAIQNEHGGPSSMKGMLVQVYTSDDVLHEYLITKVLLHQLTLDTPLRATHDQLWLQTSEGPKGTKGKTQVVAEPLLTLPADHATANPTPHPVVCG
ncbi:MAG TPA: hypothetical protein VID95_10230 [Candidatus Limnocylindrales bacterium]